MRGQIADIHRKQQILDFSQLRYNNITPMDMDGFVEAADNGCILFEVKYGDAPLKDGQKLGLVRIANWIAETGRLAWVVVLEHRVHDCDKTVNAATDCIVRTVYNPYKKDWRKPDGKEPITFGCLYQEMMDVLHDREDLEFFYWLHFTKWWGQGGMS